MTAAAGSDTGECVGWILGLTLAASLLTGCFDSFGPDVRNIGQARKIESVARPTQREFESAPLKPLPDIQRSSDRQRAQSIWYEARISLDDTPTEQWAVYVPRFAQSTEVYVNGRWIGSSGRITPPLSRNWNRPLLLRMPQRMLHRGTNTIDFHLLVQKTAPGFLGPFFVGPEAELTPAYLTREFFQVDVARFGAVSMAAIALILGFVAIRREEFPQFRFFTLGCLFWATASMEMFIEDPPFPPRIWQTITIISASTSVLLFVQTTHRSFQRARPRLERRLYVILAALAVFLSTVPDRYFEAASVVVWLFAFVVCFYLGRLFIFVERPEFARSRALVVLGFIGFVIFAHDLSHAFFGPAWPPFFLIPALSIIAALWAAWVVIDYFLRALRESETLNRELEDRVATKHAELEENYRRLRDLEQQRVVSSERERLMREMHDGMGGQLVSALAMAEDGETSLPQIADVIRAALDDMRLVIDSLDPVIDDIPTLLGMIRGRIEPRLRVHGLRFDWRVTDLPPTPGVGPEQFLHLLRIAQEAITNIVKHADASVIRVETEETPDDEGRPGIRISIGDDGKGLVEPSANGGRGLSNMRVRAERLHGSIDIVNDGADPGTTVRLWIPMDAAAAA